MRIRVGIAVAVLAPAAVVLVLISGEGDSDRGIAARSTLVWDEPPLVVHPEDLPDDRVVYGTVRNTSLEKLRAAVADLEVRDANGHELVATFRFLGSYAHGLYGPYARPDPLPEEELNRLGYQVTLAGGATSPLTVSYRLRDGSVLPVTVYYRGVPALDLPDDG